MIVLLHGLGHDHSQVAGVAARLGGAATPDLRGPSLAAMAEEARPLVGPGDVVGGVSMGAAVAHAVAVSLGAGGCRALVMIAPAVSELGLLPAAREYIDWLASVVAQGGFEALREAGEPLADEWAARYSADELVALWRGFPGPGPLPRFADVPVPALVLAWADDDLHPLDFARDVARRLPDAELVEVPPPAGPTGKLDAAGIAAAIASFLGGL
jgi:pimeloyl-ACP methyl ester carboxylesterase